MIRWKDIQNLVVTEDEINSLAGLTASSSELNILDGYTGSTIDLNNCIGVGASLTNHLTQDIVTAHPPTANSLDGLVIADGTIPEDKLDFSVVTPAELAIADGRIDTVVSDLNVQVDRIDNLYGIIFPGQGNDIAAAIQQCIDHIDNTEDAHDATAISYGEVESGYYYLSSDISSGALNTTLPLGMVRYFREADEITLDDNISIAETVTIDSINYNTGYIEFTPATATDFLVANSSRITNENENNVQDAVNRSLRNSTDTITGRLTISQNSADHALVLNQSGSGDELHFTTGKISEDAGYHFSLNGPNTFEIIDGSTSDKLFEVTDAASAIATTLELREEGTAYSGTLDKSTLTDDRTWLFPDRSGVVSLGDASHLSLLKVTADDVAGEITIADGYTLNYSNEIVRAWITMDTGSSFLETTVDISARLSTDGHLPGLGSDWIAFTICLDESDNLAYYYSGYEAVEQDALNDIAYVPSYLMKLATLTVQGDGLGDIVSSTLGVKEDLRPFLNIGMATVFYDESIVYSAGLSAFTPIVLPLNSRADNIQQKYNVGAGQLEVYVNDRFVETGRDYSELAGSPVGQINFKYDLPNDSVVRFRIEYHGAASASGGGIGSISLHNAYLTGSAISTDAVNGPVIITDGTSGTNKAMIVNGDIEINGFVDPPTGYGFVSQGGEPGDLLADYHKLYADSVGGLIYKRYNVAGSSLINITEEIERASSSQGDTFTNVTGVEIPAYSIVALHPTLPKHVRLADVSSNTSLSRVIGVTDGAISHNNSGRVVTSGRLTGAGLGFTHNDLLFADTTSPGAKISESLLSLTTGNVSVIIGMVDGDDLLVNLNRQGVYSD